MKPMSMNFSRASWCFVNICKIYNHIDRLVFFLQVYEIVERVDELKKKWPEAWGAFDNNGVSIVAPYIDQASEHCSASGYKMCVYVKSLSSLLITVLFRLRIFI